MITKSIAEINQLAKEIHVLNRKWWPANVLDRPIAQIRLLITSEVIECMEGERKDLMDDKLPHRKMAEVEMADTAIRVLDVLGAHNYSYKTKNTEEDAWCDFNFSATNKEDYLATICSVIYHPERFDWADYYFSNILFLVIQYCEHFGYNLWAAVAEKLEYNKTRYDHSDEGRAAAGGKKW